MRHGNILPVELHPHHSRIVVIHLPFETGQQWQHDDDPEFLVLVMRSEDPLRQQLDYQVLLGDEELVFDIDELLGASDQIDVGLVDGSLELLGAES